MQFNRITLLKTWDPWSIESSCIYRFLEEKCEVATINGRDRDPDKSTVEHREDGEKDGIKASLKEKN
jgi:hypothetical protein